MARRAAKRKEADPTPKGAVARVVFAEQEQNPSSSPVNVYREKVVVDGKSKLVLWCTCEDGTEKGRRQVLQTDPNTHIASLVGYDYDIPFTKDNAAKFIEEATGRTKYYIKVNAQTMGVTQEEFLNV